MTNSYHHLTRDKRCQNYALRARGVSMRSVAPQLGRDVGMISRDVSGNSGGRGYCPCQV